MSKRRVLITGAAGFVGANLARRALAEGHDVHVLLRAESDRWRLEDVERDLTIHAVSLADEAGVQVVLARSKPEWVFHLAVHGAYADQTDGLQMLKTNAVASASLLQTCAKEGAEVFVNTGSSSEYGFKDHAPNEDEALTPNSAYAVSKSAMTMYCRYFQQQQQPMRIVTLRLYSTYGPWERPTRLVPSLLKAVAAGTWPPLTDALAAHDFIYVDDVLDAYLLVAEKANRARHDVYNVGSGQQTALGELVEITRGLFPGAGEPVWGSMPSRNWDTHTWVSDSRRIIEDLGWQPRYDLQKGLWQTFEWMRSKNRL